MPTEGEDQNPVNVPRKAADHDEEKIKIRAYLLWEQEGCPEGKHLDHWEAAEKELSKESETSAPDLQIPPTE